MGNPYKIELGVHVKTNEIREQISKYNTNSNNAKLKLGIKLDTNDLKKQINSLNLGSTSGGKGITIPVNTQSLETSLKEVKGIIADIKASMGTLDGGDMKSLLSSVNQIATALGKAENESDNLVKSLNALSKKDFSVNFGFNMGKSASQVSSEQGDLKRNAISQLKQQAKALEDYLDQYYKVAQQGAGVAKLTQGTKLFGDYWEMSPNIGNTKNSLKQQVDTYKQYIGLIQQAAKLKGVDISGVTSGFSKSTDDIVKGTTNAANGIEEVKQAFKGLFGSGVDGEKLSGQLDSIVADLKEVKIILGDLSSGTSLGGLTQSFDRLSDSIENLLTNAEKVKGVLNTGSANTGMSNQAKAAQETAKALKETANIAEQVSNKKITNLGQFDDDTADTKELNTELKKLKDLAHQIGQLDFKIKKFGDSEDINQVKEFERQLELLKRQYNETVKSISGKDINIGDISTKEFVDARNKMAELDAKIADTKTKLAKKIEIDLNTGEFSTKVAKVHSDAKKLSGVYTNLQVKLDTLDAAEATMNATFKNGTVDERIESYKRYEVALQSVENQLKQNKIAEDNTNNIAKLNQQKQSLSLDMSNWLKDNSAAAKKFGGTIRELKAQLESCNDVEFGNIKREFQNIKKEAQSLGLTTKTVGDKIKDQFAQYSTYLSVASLYMYAEQGLRSMFEQVKLIDSAMTELKKVTDETDASYNKFLSNAASRSKELGTTIDGLVSSTADFARLGYGFEDAQGLAEVANIYAVVGDEIEGVEGATESLISTMAAFKDSASGMSNSDFAMSIIDKFNEIGELIA